MKRYVKIVPVLSMIFFFSCWFSASADPVAVLNYVASSTNYRLGEDSINSGGNISTSTNYTANDSLPILSGDTSTSTNYTLTAEATMSNAYLAISIPGNVTMSPAINTSGGGTGNGSASWTVTTDSSGGYSLSIKSNTSPTLKSATDGFGNYMTSVANIPDYSFRTGDGADFFGFTPEGADITSSYKDDGISLCGTGSNDTTDKCWDSITTTTKTFAHGTSSNHPNGTNTTVKFRAFAGLQVHKAAGSYSATITVTALSL